VQNGKGDDPRIKDYRKYWSNFEEIKNLGKNNKQKKSKHATKKDKNNID